ncbi:MAG: flippase [Oscillospiraceae bacterium]|nr:flippase [Oscillospiraceae bacterium]
MEKTSIKKNFMYQMIYEILIIILPFVTSPYIARVIGAEGQGMYSYSYSIAYYFVLFSMLGLKNYGNRAIARARDDSDGLNKTFSNILALHIIISILCFTVYVIYVSTLKTDKLFAFIQTAYVLSGLFDVSWFFFGIEKFKLTVMRSTIIKILNVICIFVFVRNSEDLWKYCLIMSLGMLISQLTLWIPLRKYVRIVRPHWKEMTTHLKPMLIFFIPAIAVSLYKYMDKIMIGALSNKTQLGFYENAEKVNNIPMTIISSFGTVMLPKMSNLAAKSDNKKSTHYMSLSMQFVMCLAFALAFGLAGVGQIFAPIFWGDEFQLSGKIIMGLSITIPFISFANVIRTQYLIPHAKDREYLTSVVAGAVINLSINYLLIPKHGAIGATIGTIAAEILVCLIQTYSVRKDLPLLNYFKSFAVFIIFGAIIFGVNFCIGKYCTTNIITLIIQILCGVIIYCILSLLFFIYKKDETILKIRKKLFKKFGKTDSNKFLP